MGFSRNTKTATSAFFKPLKIAALAVCALLPLPFLCRAQTDPQTIKEIQAEKRLIETNPRLAFTLAQRIARSKLGGRISLSKNSLQKTKEVEAWLLKNPEVGAVIGLGLAQDSANGNHDFENILNQKLSHWVANPGAVHNAYYQLKNSSRKLRAMKRDQTMTNEERVSILNALFEGQASASNQIIRRRQVAGHASEAPATSLSANFYNRLSLTNLAGYSPDVAALQNQMNRQAVPGAPTLPETGYLNSQTLAYPAYALRYDLSNLKNRLNLTEAYALAKKLGRNISPQEAQDPVFLSRLRSEAGQKGVAIPKDYLIQSQTIAKAAAAIKDFEEEALKSADKKNITPHFLMTLGSKQREASRWISAAFLEEDMNRADDEERLLTPELKATISACPVSAQERGEYLSRGQGYFETLTKLKQDDFKALDDLLNHWPQKAPQAEKWGKEGARLRKNLAQDINDFASLPYQLAHLSKPEPRWKNWMNQIARRFFSWTSYGREIASRDARRAALQSAFLSVAMGDENSARRMLHPR